MLMRRLAILAGFALLASGNDGSATSTPAGGIQLTREPRISMEKERLTISKSKITVEYEFLNTSDRDITTEVAFPVPPYVLLLDDPEPDRGLDDFRIWVGGQPVQYQTEAKAMRGGQDYGGLLRSLGADIVGFGHFSWGPKDDTPMSRDIQKLSSSQQSNLAHLGLIDPEVKLPNWTVVKTYHWRQTFPARKPIQVRHEYKPVLGLGRTFGEGLKGADQVLGPHSVLGDQGREKYAYENQGDVKFSDACVDAPLMKVLMTAANRKNKEGYFRDVYAYWVDYILTTANTWKTPIRDFELVIERPKPEQSTSHFYVSLC
jgi:hypothetical protein